MITTAKLTTVHNNNLATTEHLTITTFDDGYTITFDDVEIALKAVEQAKARSWAEYLASGGNPRNKRSHSSQYTAIAKAIKKAAS